MSQYNGIAEQYLRIKRTNPVDQFCFYPGFYDAIGDVRGKRVLDVATGGGKVAREMANRGAKEVVAIDDSSEMLRFARAQTSPDAPITYRQAKFGEMGSIGSFDVITGGWILHYARTQYELRRMCNDIIRNLVQGGTFVALNANPDCPVGGSEMLGYVVSAVGNLRNGSPLKVEIIGEDKERVSFEIYNWSVHSYEKSFRDYGLDLKISLPTPTREGITEMGGGYWLEYAKAPTSAIFTAQSLAR